MKNILMNLDRKAFRIWLQNNAEKETECWVANLKRGKPKDDDGFYYLDAVEEALCFGWIDSVYKKVDGKLYQRFSPRSSSSNWTVLNIARVKRLNDLSLMTEKGLNVVPSYQFEFDADIIADIKEAGIYETFISFPKLYQQVRICNLSQTKRRSLDLYKKSLKNLIKYTKLGKTIGDWDDCGRLNGYSI